ncbi:MAG: ABC transporter ATP-binding protein [Deltaproteobacteria bacterium]|nr:ABC transporter ATP-binding protein [Deltaproteobacteria bacterium]
MTRGSTPIVRNVSLTFRGGELVLLLGPSGSGKSTLLRAMNGFRPGVGRVTVDGQDLYACFDTLKRSIGYVPQDDVLHASLTVRQALDYAARLRLPEMQDGARAAELTRVIAEVGLAERRDVRVRHLSGGQRKRVSVAMELLAKPALFFLDEPTSGLDPGLEAQVMALLRRLTTDERFTLVTTHVVTSSSLADLAVFMAKGRVVYVGPPVDASGFFGVDSLAEIYSVIARDEDAWARRFESSSLFRTYVVDRPRVVGEFGSSLGASVGAPSLRTPSAMAMAGAEPSTIAESAAIGELGEVTPEQELARLKAELRARRDEHDG